jgi:adenine/guanine phosphoribosyltransferase-like PRPP-binding protein
MTKEVTKMATHAEDLKFRLATVELLRTAKKRYTYRELSAKTNLPVTVLSRYVKGHVLPNTERAHDLWEALSKIVGLESELRRRIKFDRDGYFDNTSIIGDLNLLGQAANHALAKFAGKRITKVLTAAVDGVPLATMVANALGVNIAIAKSTKEVGVTSFLEETYVLEGSGFTVTLYVPKLYVVKDKEGTIRRELTLKKSDSVLVVDDIIKSGGIQSALLNLVGQAKAEVSGIFALIAVGDSWKKKMRIPQNCQVEIILRA